MNSSVLSEFEQRLADAAEKFDVVFAKYAEIIQHEQFVINELTTIEDISDGTIGSIDLSHKINQQTLFTSLLFCIPTGATSATIQLGRYSFTIDSPNTVQVLYPIQFVLGSGDKIKISWTPVGTHAGYFALFGRKTGGNYTL